MPQAVTVAPMGLAAVNAKNVTTAAALLIETVTSDRKNITIQNLGPNAIYVGFSSAVTTATGFQVPANGGTLAMDLGNGTQVYAIAATADQASPLNTRVLEQR